MRLRNFGVADLRKTLIEALTLADELEQLAILAMPERTPREVEAKVAAIETMRDAAIVQVRAIDDELDVLVPLLNTVLATRTRRPRTRSRTSCRRTRRTAGARAPPDDDDELDQPLPDDQEAA